MKFSSKIITPRRENMSLRSALRDNRVLRRLFYPAVIRLRQLRRLAGIGTPLIDAGPVLDQAIRQALPCAVGKIGAVELRGLRHYLSRLAARDRGVAPRPYPADMAGALFLNAGVFPRGDDAFDRFGACYLDAVRKMDVLAMWFNPGERQVLRRECPATALVTLPSLEPFLSSTPWSMALEGKRVLVIHPFTDTIRRQHARRTELWEDRRVLPDFELLTLQAPLSAGLSPPAHATWSDALAELTDRMDARSYDVAIIGAGAFSLPLAVHAKQRGAVGIHLGGAAQILWGIIGTRWEEGGFQRFFRESWVRPSPAETPEGTTKIERGAYW
jgi:hypothetical protein